MDDSYFTKLRTNANGNDNFYSNNKDLAPVSIKFKRVATFEEKILVYIVICGFLSNLFSQVVDQFTNRNNFLTSFLLPFIKRYRSDGTWQAAIMNSH